MSAPREWFRDWFGETYLALYPHRDEEEAAAAVRLLVEAGPPDPERPVLDLACGAGRHLRAMRREGLRPVGVDLSLPLLRSARRAAEDGPPPLVRGDMRRLPFADRAFGAVTNFFTSFGYFATEEEDRSVVAEAGRVLAPGGVFLLDYLNAPRVRAGLVPEDEAELGGRRVRQRRWVEGETVVKRIEIEDPGREPRVHHERVRLYDPEPLEALLRTGGLRTERRFGDYDGSPHGAESARLILAGRRA